MGGYAIKHIACDVLLPISTLKICVLKRVTATTIPVWTNLLVRLKDQEAGLCGIE